jgi:hypothetical protein
MLCIFAIQTNQIIMKMQRELLLQISEVETKADAFKVAENVMFALRDGQITPKQYVLLINELYVACKNDNISTENELVSLF